VDGLTGQALPGRVGLSAPAMAAAVSLDPQFTLPVRPRLLAHLVLVDLGDGLLVEGTAERQVLRGHAATDLLPALLPLLDGTRRIDDLAGALDRPGRQVHAAVALLYACGLLEDADDRAPRPVAVPAEAAAFLGRHLDTTRVDRSVGAALARLATARVVVVGPAGAEAVAGALRRAGVPQATAAGHGGWRHALAAATDGIDLVLALGAPDPLPRELDDWCAQARVPWLRSAHGSAGVEIGPRFEAGLTACYRCFAEELPAGGRGRPGARRRAAWHGLVVDEVLALLSRVLVARSTGGVTTVDLDGWSDRTVLVPRRPGCPRCCPDGGTARREPELAHRYEQAVAFPPRHLLDPKDHQHHYRPANLALQALAKEYPAARHVALAHPDRTPQPAGAFPDLLAARHAAPAALLDRAVLAGLLLRVGGRREDPAGGDRRGGKVQRWAATGGNLGSVQLYVLAAGVDGLAPGWWFYEPARHRLALVRRCADTPGDRSRGVVGAPAPPRRPAAAQLARRLLGGHPAPAPAAVIVSTGALARVAGKYHDFAYRIVHLDAGVATAQLQALATGYGLATRVAPRVDDGLLREELRLDPADEPVTAVLGLYGREPR